MFIWYLFCRYYKYFLGKLHQNLIGVDHEKSVYILSVLQEKSFGKLQLRAILWTKLGPKRLQFCSQAELGTDFIGTERLTESENYTRSNIWGVFYPKSRNKITIHSTMGPRSKCSENIRSSSCSQEKSVTIKQVLN